MGGEVFLAELDVVDPGSGGFADFFEQMRTAGSLMAGELGAIGDVAEQRTWHRECPRCDRELWRASPSGTRLRDLGKNLSLSLGRASQVVARQAVAQEFEAFFGGVDHLEQLEILGG